MSETWSLSSCTVIPNHNILHEPTATFTSSPSFLLSHLQTRKSRNKIFTASRKKCIWINNWNQKILLGTIFWHSPWSWYALKMYTNVLKHVSSCTNKPVCNDFTSEVYLLRENIDSLSVSRIDTLLSWLIQKQKRIGNIVFTCVMTHDSNDRRNRGFVRNGKV